MVRSFGFFLLVVEVFSTAEGFPSERDLDNIFFLYCPHLADTAACVHGAEFMYLK